MKKSTLFFCTECGNEFSKWTGKCASCGAWNSMTEAPTADAAPASRMKNSKSGVHASHGTGAVAVSLSDISTAAEVRFQTGLGELDRVLGGGAVVGSLVLISGEPGIGKSTLLMQICRDIARFAKILYVSGEESLLQLKLRSQRLKVSALRLLAETQLTDVLTVTAQEKPDVLIIDSIQTMYSPELNSAPGSVAQVKQCSLELMNLAKSQGITIFIIGHVNKEGAIAGPKVLEHMVDCVLYFEGERHLVYRILRAEKNRFGSTQEIGVFEMSEDGLLEVPNPSERLLSGRPTHVPGTCVACVMEGTRPVLAEVQALVTPTTFGTPRRTVSGLDFNRAMLLLAVLEKRGGLFVGNQDAYLNVIGGLKLIEPGCDLPSILAVASSFKDKPILEGMVAFGEVGLTGEIRNVTCIQQRLAECFRLGFTQCIIPAQGTKNIPAPEGLQVYRARTVKDAIALALAP